MDICECYEESQQANVYYGTPNKIKNTRAHTQAQCFKPFNSKS